VTVVHHDTFPCVNNAEVDSAAEMRKAVHHCFSECGGADIYISAAAISDFAPRRIPGKIPSGKPVRLDLEPLPKLLDEVIRNWTPVTIAFKLDPAPEEKSADMIRQGVSMVLINSPKTMGSREGEYIQLTASGRVPLHGSKEEIARAVWDEVTRGFITSSGNR
jgi:phosphopantothenoylcysteine decarboxylase / phosphopantothenate---cysteine ligase